MVNVKKINMLKDDPTLECDWSKVLPVANSSQERARVVKINSSLFYAPYPLTREYLNSFYQSSNHYLKTFIKNYDCASDMYSFFVQTYKKQGTPSGDPGSAGAGMPTGSGSSYGFNPFFGVDSPLSFGIWLLIIAGAFLLLNKD